MNGIPFYFRICFISVILALLFSFSGFGQNGAYDLRLVVDTIDCQGSYMDVDVEIKAHDAASNFSVTSANFRISFSRNTLAFDASQIPQPLTLNDLVATPNGPLDYAAYTYTLTGSIDTIISLNMVQWLGAYPLDEINWVGVARLRFNIIDPSGCFNIWLHKPPVFPPTAVTEWVSSNNHPVTVAEDFYNIDQLCLSPICQSTPDPVVALNDNYSLFQNESLIGNVSSNDTGSNLVYNTLPVASPSNGTVTINTNGTFFYQPDAGFSGSDTFSYQVCDGTIPSNCNTATVYIQVYPLPGGQYDLDISLDSVDCTNNKAYASLFIRAQDAQSHFNFTSANLRFSFDNEVLTNPAIHQELDIAGYFNPPSLNGSAGNIVSFNLVGGNYPVGHLDWTSIATLVFDVVDPSGCVDFTWHDDSPTNFPNTVVRESCGNGQECEVEEGTYSQMNACIEAYCPAVCTTPELVEVINLTHNSVQIYSTLVSATDMYEIRYKKVGTPGYFHIFSTTNTFLLDNLAPFASYEYSFRALCDLEWDHPGFDFQIPMSCDRGQCNFDGSDWSSAYSFKTNTLPRPSLNIGLNNNKNHSSGKPDIHIYPNPATNWLKLQSSVKGVEKLEILSLSGTPLVQLDGSKIYDSIDLSSYPPGMYFLTVQFEDGLRLSKRFIKN